MMTNVFIYYSGGWKPKIGLKRIILDKYIYTSIYIFIGDLDY